MWLRLAGRAGRPRVRDGGHAHIRGLGTPRPLFVARPLSKVERGAPGGRCSGDKSRSCCARAGDARAASLAETGMSNRGLARVGKPLASGWCGYRLQRGGAGGELPAVGGELAGDRDRDDPAGFVADVFELAPAGVEATLRLPGDVDDLGCLPALAALERFTDRGAAAVSGRTLRPAAGGRGWSRPW